MTPPQNTWDSIGQSPLVTAVFGAQADFQESAGLPRPLDLRLFIRPESMPIENIRALFELLAFAPATEIFGEDFERRLVTRIYAYYQNRNRQAGLDLLAHDGLFSYTYTWTVSGGRRTGLNLFVTPTPFTQNNIAWVAYILRAVDWVIPHFEGQITVTLVTAANTPLRATVGGAHREVAMATVGG